MTKLILEAHTGKFRAIYAFGRWWFNAAGSIAALTCVWAVVWWVMPPLLAGEPFVTLTAEDFRKANQWAFALWLFMLAWRSYRRPEESIVQRVRYLWRGWICLTSVTWGTPAACKEVEVAINNVGAR